jgi:hypothetical protein
MGSAKEQKDHEKFLLERFLENQGISPTCIQQPNPPAPDFLIDLEGRKVGIELTELFVRSKKSKAHPQPEEEQPLQAVEHIADKIVSDARKIYFDAGNPLVMSTIFFSDRITLDKKKGGQIAKLIAHQIQSMSLQNSQKVDWRSIEDENEEHPLSESVVSIHV